MAHAFLSPTAGQTSGAAEASEAAVLPSHRLGLRVERSPSTVGRDRLVVDQRPQQRGPVLLSKDMLLCPQRPRTRSRPYFLLLVLLLSFAHIAQFRPHFYNFTK